MKSVITLKGALYQPLARMGHKLSYDTLHRGETMYLKKIEGPRSVKLPDGSILTRADLPPAHTHRWVASRKACVVKAVANGLLSRDEAKTTYGLSDDELTEWESAVREHGEKALKATSLQKYRQL